MVTKSSFERLFGRVKFVSRKNLLAILTENTDVFEKRDLEVDVGIIKDAECIFTRTFF